MLLQRLVDHAANMENPLPSGYGMTSVRYEIHLDDAGALESPEPIDLATPDNKFGQRRAVPQMRRSGVKPPPILLADHAEYTLGLARKPENADKAVVFHQQYLQLLAECATATDNPAVRAVQTFLTGAPLAVLMLPDGFDRGGAIEFRVNGRLVTQESDVRRFWDRRNQPDGELMQCLVCHMYRPVLTTLPRAVKGLPGSAQSGATLITANADAFLSYGLTQSKISPICASCADQFTMALNALLADRSHHLRIAKTVYLFWTQARIEFSLSDWFENPDPAQVRELINAVRTGAYDPGSETVPFHTLALTANKSRVVVRDWLDTTVGWVKSSLGRWFARQAIVKPYGEAPAPLGLYTLAASTVRDPNNELNSLTVTTLLRSALSGATLPDQLLQQAVRRCQVERDVTFGRAALIKLVLSTQSPAMEDLMIERQTDYPDAAYHCGRLLAVLENIQRSAADGQLNTTLVDRFYGAASSAPASVFGTLLRNAQPHVAKLRKRKRGAALRLEQEMENILHSLSEFPPILTTKQQAIFALGYYHQRAFNRAQGRAASASKIASNSVSETDSAETVLKQESTK